MFRALVTLVLVVLFVVAMVHVEGPGLMRDVQLRNAALVPAQDMKIEEARCRSHWWIVSSCTVSYRAAQQPQQQQQQRQSISFTVFGSLGGEPVQLLRTADNRTVTTDIGLAKLTNRITTAVFFLLIVATIGFFAARRALQMA
jgi:hypothetical protein